MNSQLSVKEAQTSRGKVLQHSWAPAWRVHLWLKTNKTFYMIRRGEELRAFGGLCCFTTDLALHRTSLEWKNSRRIAISEKWQKHNEREKKKKENLFFWGGEDERTGGTVGKGAEVMTIGETLRSIRAEVGGRRQTDGRSFLPRKNVEAFWQLRLI